MFTRRRTGKQGTDRGTYSGGSLVFNGSSQYLTRTFGTSTDINACTVSFWMKGDPQDGASHFIFGAYQGSLEYTNINFVNGFFILDTRDGSTTARNRDTEDAGLLRDPHKWYHVVMQFDMDAGAANIWTVYVDNVLYADAVRNSTLTQIHLNDSSIYHIIGARNTGSVSTHYSGYLADFHWIDGDHTVAPTEFAEVSADTGAWVPKAYTGSYGNNGYRLTFDSADGDTTTVTDQSGNGNDWTENGYSSVVGSSYTADNPTDNAATMTWERNAFGTLSNGNRNFEGESSARGGVRTSLWMTSGKYVGEFTDMDDGVRVGLVNQNVLLDGTPTDLGGDTDSFRVQIDTTTDSNARYNGSTTTLTGHSFIKGTDVCRIEFDRDTGDVEVFKNATSIHTDTLTVANGEQWFFCIFDATGTLAKDANYNSGIDGFANTPTSGFKALTSANLPEPTIKLPQEHADVVLATGANIESDISTAIAGWTNHVVAIKDRDTAEVWYWRFSHDASNEYDVSTTSTYGAIGTLSGTEDHVAYCFRCDNPNIASTGSVVVSGSDETVTHNSGTARVMILVFPRSGGEVFVYHPDATSGELLYLTGTEADFASTAITSVTSTQFTLDQSVIGNDTYDYLVLAENDVHDMGSYEGNGNADGTLIPTDELLMFMQKQINTARDWKVYDQLRNTYNPASLDIKPNSNVAEATISNAMDFISNGIKLRTSDTGVNQSGGTYIWFGIKKIDIAYS